MRIGRVDELWRYPVKSMGGERVSAIDVGTRGLRGDRLWAVRDEEAGVLTNAKRLPALLMCTARFVDEPATDADPDAIPAVAITFPDGRTLSSSDPAIHDRLSAYLGRRVTLHALRPASDRAHYRAVRSDAAEMRAQFAIADDEPLPDFSMMPLAKLIELGRYATPPGTYFDASALHIVTAASLAALRAASGGDGDVRRFRPNVVIATNEAARYVEPAWEGGELTFGGCRASVDCATPRCSMPTRAQPELAADPRMLKELARNADRCLGVYATVRRIGAVRVGDDVALHQTETSRLGEWSRQRATALKRALLKAALPRR